MTAHSEKRNLKYNLHGYIPSFTDRDDDSKAFDVLTATAGELQQLLTDGKLKSTTLVEEYQRAVLAYNGYLNAVYELAPDAMKKAEELDEQRAKADVKGPLHGIPILIKDNVNTDPSMGMKTTGGSLALFEGKPARSASIVTKLVDAGAIVLGKASLSEMAFFKGKRIRCGWSSLSGHAQSAYVRGGLVWEDPVCGHSSPLGSSAGSAIAVSAGLAPLSIGSETSGSLVAPANRAGLYTVKPTLGIVPGYGVMPVSRRFDTAGPICKSAKDVADLLTALVDPAATKVPKGGYAAALTDSWSDIRVGTLDPRTWRYSETALKYVSEADDEILEKTLAAYKKIKGLAKSYHENVSSLSTEDFKFGDEDSPDAIDVMMTSDAGADLDAYFSDLASSPIRSLRDLVKWNLDHADQALPTDYPSQDRLVAALIGTSHSERARALSHMNKTGASFVDTFDKYDIDVIIGPSDSGICEFSSAAGFPIGTLPLGVIKYNGRPCGLTIAARRHHEATLVKVMGAFEATFEKCPPPEAVLEAVRAGKGSEPERKGDGVLESGFGVGEE